jgi:hypothetical protein
MSKNLTKQHKDPGSFRDPAGFIFSEGNAIYRFISPSYYPEYMKLKNAGLYQELIDSGYLLPFEEVEQQLTPSGATLIIKPLKIPFISYPYEWTFSQLQDAAKVTLAIQKISLKYGMQLKDASAYNIQFVGSKPVFIDTLSFEKWNQRFLWTAYRQFCQHFVAPLTICSFCDPRMKSLFLANLDGIPLDLAKQLIPIRGFLSVDRFLHLWLHELFQKQAGISNQGARRKIKSEKPSSSAFALLDSLLASITNLTKKQERSLWKSYDPGDSYQKEAFEQKKHIVVNLLSDLKPQILWDLGANDGFFTQMTSKYCQYSVALDLDLSCIENMYHSLRQQKNTSILPLHIDIANSSPGIGWENEERKSLIQRGPCDVAIALALIHHLLVSAGIPLNKLVMFFQRICHQLVIEYIPPSDPKFHQICQTNPNDFSFFTEDAFIAAFMESFVLKARIPIGNSSRVIYHFQTKKKKL